MQRIPKKTKFHNTQVPQIIPEKLAVLEHFEGSSARNPGKTCSTSEESGAVQIDVTYGEHKEHF